MLNDIKNARKLSFLLDGAPFDTLDPKVTVTQSENCVQTVYEFEGGLRLTNTARYYPAFDACDWVNEWENTGARESGVISALRDCDVVLPLPPCEPKVTGRAYLARPEEAVKLYAPRGSDWSGQEFTCDVDRLLGSHYPYWFETVGSKKCFFAVGGRSSDAASAPFFNIKHGKKNMGYVVAIGWTGQWKADLERVDDGILLQSGVMDVNFKILPGEKFRTSSVTIMGYRGTAQEGQNRFRRLIREVYSPISMQKTVDELPFCAGLWGGMSTKGCLERIQKVEKAGLPFNCYWMDAGWYGAGDKESPDEYEGDWAQHTGNWEINRARHPDLLEDVVAAIGKTDKKFLLWFEPERVRTNAPIAKEHPEYLLYRTTQQCPDTLLNLGNEQAWQYCFDTLSGLIEHLGVSVYRQDFNFRPLPYWQENDTDPDRRGMTEILHINGMYRLWDALLERFPGLLIDNCASGGRRIDMETLRRSIPLWRSDAQCPADPAPELTQAHALSHSAWMPYSGTSTGRVWFDTYAFRSAYAPALTTGYTFSEKNSFGEDAEAMAWLTRMSEEYLRVKPYLVEDVYPLTTAGTADDVWSAVQYHAPDRDAGVVQLFRRARSPFSYGSFPLFGLSPERDYIFEDADGGSFTVKGSVLLGEGLGVRMDEKRSSKVLFYRAK